MFRLFRIVGLLTFFVLIRGVVWGEPPTRKWALVGAINGAGVRYLATPNIYLEGRGLYGEGTGLSARGAYQWNRGFKIRPSAGIELSLLAPMGDHGEAGQAMELFAGVEGPLLDRLSFQIDMGPALVHLNGDDDTKEAWEYENVINVSVQWYFGRSVR